MVRNKNRRFSHQLPIGEAKEKRVGIPLLHQFCSVTAGRLASAVREHWGIENQQHWVLDVSMDEDNCQIYRGHAATNLACLRHMALNMLRAETSKALSVPRKQLKALLHEDYLEKILMTYLGANKI